jgi:hypothetical protein
MAPVLAMMEKGVNAIRERLISLCKEIDDNVNVNALQDPTIVFRVRKEDITTKIVGAMHKTAYCHYLVWYKKASKAAKHTASVAQLGPSRTHKLVITQGLMAGKHHCGKGASR